MDFKTINEKDLDGILNTELTVFYDEGKTLKLELVEVDEKTRDNIYSLSLIFKGPADKVLMDNTYRFEDEKFGSFELFISPYQQKENDVFYDSHISRFIEK